jgi:hypothetical protein
MTGCPCGNRCVCHGYGGYKPECRIDGVLVPGGCGSMRREAAALLPTERACLGPCNNTWRAAWRTYQEDWLAWSVKHAVWESLIAAGHRDAPEPPEPPRPLVAATPGEPLWCLRCAGVLGRALAELDDLAALAAAAADGHRGQPATERASSGGPAASPSPVADMLDELYGVLANIEDQWRDARGYDRRPQRDDKGGAQRGASARTLTISWLGQHLGEILDDPWSATVARNVFAWQRRLQDRTSSAPLASLRPVRCPRCAQRAVRRRDDGYSICRQCGRLLSEQEVQALVAG